MAEAPARAILHVTALHGGGVDRHVRDIAAAVPGRHFIWHAGANADVLECPGEPRFLPLDHARLDAQFAVLAAWLRSQGIGLVHLHSTDRAPRYRTRQICEAVGVPSVVTLHDVLFLRPDAFEAGPEAAPDCAWLAEVALSLASAKAVLAPSRFVAGLAERHFPGLSVEVVPNGSRPPSARKLAPHPQFEAHRPKHVVALLGAIGPHKGSELLESLPGLLEETDIGLVVIGYLERQFVAGWRVPGRLFVHGPFDDEDAPALLRAYGAGLVLFPGSVPESFSYALSDTWRAGLPALAAPVGALAERIGQGGGGWLLAPDFDAASIAAALPSLVESPQPSLAPGAVPSLEAMTRSLDALYARFGIDPAAPGTSDPKALQSLLATTLDSSLFRQELARVAEEYAQVKAALDDERTRAAAFAGETRQWIAKLEADIAALNVSLACEVEKRRHLEEANARLQVNNAAFERLPAILRRVLAKKVRDARS